MRILQQLVVDPLTVYDACRAGISEAALTARLNVGRQAINARFQEYLGAAPQRLLHQFQPSGHGDDLQPVIGGLVKKDLTSLYTKHMAAAGSAGRSYYDQITMLAPGGICPYCGFGQVATLDHFMPKARYPAFSVQTSNLVPSCRDCNSGKSGAPVTAATQTMHPYFEDSAVETDVWLQAAVTATLPVSISFSVIHPPNWPAARFERMSNHFVAFDLARRFGVQAGQELTEVAAYLARLPGPLRHDHLLLVAQVERNLRKNSWKAAMFHAIANSTWYLSHGVPPYQALPT